VQGAAVPLGAAYAPVGGHAQIGVRPEFVRLRAGGEGLPARITRVEDVGRHKIVRLDVGGTAANAILDEGEPVPAGADRIVFDAHAINVYADEWRVAPQGAQGRAA